MDDKEVPSNKVRSMYIMLELLRHINKEDITLKLDKPFRTDYHNMWKEMEVVFDEVANKILSNN